MTVGNSLAAHTHHIEDEVLAGRTKKSATNPIGDEHVEPAMRGGGELTVIMPAEGDSRGWIIR
jgi:hypothetical protein